MRIITRRPRPGVGKAGQTGGQDAQILVVGALS